MWQIIIFSDECKKQLHSNANEYVRRPVGERYNSRYMTKTVKIDGCHAMAENYVKIHGRKKLLKLDRNLNSDNNIALLRFDLLSDLRIWKIFSQ